MRLIGEDGARNFLSVVFGTSICWLVPLYSLDMYFIGPIVFVTSAVLLGVAAICTLATVILILIRRKKQPLPAHYPPVLLLSVCGKFLIQFLLFFLLMDFPCALTALTVGPALYMFYVAETYMTMRIFFIGTRVNIQLKLVDTTSYSRFQKLTRLVFLSLTF